MFLKIGFSALALDVFYHKSEASEKTLRLCYDLGTILYHLLYGQVHNFDKSQHNYALR